MNEMVYGKQIQQYNEQIAECKAKMSKLKKEIQEAEEAYENAECYEREFFMFISDSRMVNNSFLDCSLLHSMSGLVAGIKETLEGNEFSIASDNMAEMKYIIKSEIIRLYNDYEKYEHLLVKLNEEKVNLIDRCDSCIEE